MYEALCNRADKYNASLQKLKQLEKDGVVYVIRPDKPLEIKRIENNPVKTREIYEEGRLQAEKNLTKLNHWLESQ